MNICYVFILWRKGRNKIPFRLLFFKKSIYFLSKWSLSRIPNVYSRVRFEMRSLLVRQGTSMRKFY
ncbi:hypothetical protein HMPREF1640_01360 [Prevotella sp. S7-1-8]|nr:hypothetical protein HMPREF1640_01360 [Prevotella sp. S7-1-8]